MEEMAVYSGIMYILFKPGYEFKERWKIQG